MKTNTEDLYQAIYAASLFTSNPSRPGGCTSILLDIGCDGDCNCNVVATDGHAMAVYSIDLQAGPEQRIVINGTSVKPLVSWLSIQKKTPQELQVIIETNTIQFVCGLHRHYALLNTDDIYPPYKKIIPNHTNTKGDAHIAVNPHYITKAGKAFGVKDEKNYKKQKSLHLQFGTTHLEPIVITSNANPNLKIVIMPMVA